MGFSSRKSSSSSAASGIMFLSVRAEKSSPQKTFRGCRQHRPLCPSGNSSPESASLPLPFSGSNASPLLASAKVSATFPDARRRPPDKRAWRLRGSANYGKLNVTRHGLCLPCFEQDRKSTRLNSSHVAISYAVFCLKKKNKKK